VQNALVDQALASYEATVLAATKRSRTRSLRRRTSSAARRALQSGVESARRASDLALTQYNSGLVDFQTVLDADRQLITLEDSLAVSDGEMTAQPGPPLQGARRRLERSFRKE
jgi:outer membrane protein TolC